MYTDFNTIKNLLSMPETLNYLQMVDPKRAKQYSVCTARPTVGLTERETTKKVCARCTKQPHEHGEFFFTLRSNSTTLRKSASGYRPVAISFCTQCTVALLSKVFPYKKISSMPADYLGIVVKRIQAVRLLVGDDLKKKLYDKGYKYEDIKQYITSNFYIPTRVIPIKTMTLTTECHYCKTTLHSGGSALTFNWTRNASTQKGGEHRHAVGDYIVDHVCLSCAEKVLVTWETNLQNLGFKQGSVERKIDAIATKDKEMTTYNLKKYKGLFYGSIPYVHRLDIQAIIQRMDVKETFFETIVQSVKRKNVQVLSSNKLKRPLKHLCETERMEFISQVSRGGNNTVKKECYCCSKEIKETQCYFKTPFYVGAPLSMCQDCGFGLITQVTGTKFKLMTKVDIECFEEESLKVRSKVRQVLNERAKNDPSFAKTMLRLPTGVRGVIANNKEMTCSACSETVGVGRPSIKFIYGVLEGGKRTSTKEEAFCLKCSDGIHKQWIEDALKVPTLV